MPDFNYEAFESSGAKSAGTLTAGSEREAATMLEGRGLFPVRIALARVSQAEGRFFSGRVPRRHLATMYSQLADLMHSGVPLMRSLELLERQSPNARLKAVLRDVRMKVADGTTLAAAMAQHPKAFDELAVSMVRAGQEGGFLEDVLKRTAQFVEDQEDLKSKVVGSLAYPVFLAIAGFVVLNVLVIFIVPRFEPIFDRLKAKGELPALTTYMLAFSHFMQSWRGFALVAAGLAAAIGLYYWTRGSGRRAYDGFKLRVPLLGKVALALSLSRFTRILGTMMHNGIPILKALSIAKDSTANRVLAEAIDEAAENVTSGQKLADPLRKCKYFPLDIVEMIAIAEESNNLEKVLIDISDGLEKRTARNLELTVKMLEPLMLLVMASAVLVIVLSLLLPVFKMGSVVSGG
jgi:general secretion pathway protein F/type IV pilus assembly protein PilC